jgi:hypothetical protein
MRSNPLLVVALIALVAVTIGAAAFLAVVLVVRSPKTTVTATQPELPPAPTKPATKAVEPAVVDDVADVFRAYEQNVVAAERAYSNRPIIVRNARFIAAGERRNLFVIAHFACNSGAGQAFAVEMASDDEVASLKAGNFYNLRGEGLRRNRFAIDGSPAITLEDARLVR